MLSLGASAANPVVGMSLLGIGDQLGGGLASHVFHIARALAARAEESYVFFVPASLEETWRDSLPGRAELIACPVSHRLQGLRVIYESIVLPRLALRSGCQVLFYPNALAPANGIIPCVVTVHDLMYLSQATYFSWRKRTYLDLMYRRLARSRMRLVTHSEFSRQEIHSRLGVPLDRITAILNGVDEVFFEPGSHAKPVCAPSGQYLLSVAAAYPHKHLPLVIRAFERIVRAHAGMFLVLVGTHLGQREEMERLEGVIRRSPVCDRIVRLSPVPRNDMPALYHNAVALVQASSYEGYGLPVAEAMAAGTPVVAAPAGATLEVLSGWGVIASSWEDDDLARAIETVLEWSGETRARHVRGAKLFAEAYYCLNGVAATLSRQFINEARSG